ncbi:MAG: D-glycero-beta-D-manno-heptose-7-phosphate kinase [Candidatus Marinimicrobia bacterium]|nr:D-glycero-beta-D-manno-heptose-7-phosphate kinase [Candidatus Neomarinimicrobiota bacterium]|tara:strand:- start:6855 stop:7838 length:984 start_codon:yes stop_codon:yes gene_type:complete
MISYKRYIDLEYQFENLNILIVGDAMLDSYVWGEVSRISSEAPVPVIKINSSSSNLGGATNVVSNIQSLGAKATIASVIGDDLEGKILKSQLLETGVDISMLLIDPSRPTTVKTRILAQNQQVVRTDREDIKNLSLEHKTRLIDKINKKIDTFDGIILENYDKGLLDNEIISEIIELSKRTNKKVYVDPKEKDFFSFQGVEMVKPNAYEVSLAMDSNISEKNIDKIGVELRKRLECEILLITLGKSGMALFDNQGFNPIPTRARSVHDVSGAGDTVISVFSLAHLSGASPKEAAEIANFAAGRVCEEVGVAPITRRMLREIIEVYQN